MQTNYGLEVGGIEILLPKMLINFCEGERSGLVG
jgi:hypothetical protein